MLETIREYALERLAASGDEPITRRAHAAYCLVLAEEIGSARVTPVVDSAEWLDRCEQEHGNLRAALEWLCRNDQGNWGLRLGGALFQFWERREYISEGRNWLAKLLALASAAPRDKVRARAAFAAGVLAGAQRDYELARTLFGESLEINRETDDKWAAAVSLNALAVTALDRRDVAAARSLSEQNLDVWRELGDRAAVGRSLSNLASVVKEQGDYRARPLALRRGARDVPGDGRRDRRGARHEQAGGRRPRAGRRRRREGTVRAKPRDVPRVRRPLGNRARAGRSWQPGSGGEGLLAGPIALSREPSNLPGPRLQARRRADPRELRVAPTRPRGRQRGPSPLRAPRRRSGTRSGLRSPRSTRRSSSSRLDTARRSLPGAEGASAWMEGWTTPLDETVEAVLRADAG